MGLDNYFVKHSKAKPSDHVIDDYFRGNIYYRFILELCGINIYIDWVPPNAVKEICNALYEALIAKPGTDDYDLIKLSEFERKELELLLNQFMKYVSKGYGLYGSY